MNHRIATLLPSALLPLALAALASGQYGPDNLPPEVHPPVMEPIPDGIQLEVPKELGNQKLAQWGFVDVTAAPFFADPTGRKDSTEALQRAINFARDAQMACFFPPGTYLVSDTLLLRHGIHMRSHRATFINDQNMPCVLIGSRRGEKRPRIVLRDGAPGFDDPQHPKYVIENIQYDVDRFAVRKNRNGGGPSLMNMMFVGIDVDLGHGNPGAIGMHVRSCEGSAVQDVTIDARGGLAGIAGATGNGGSWTNITVLGGQIGLDMRGWTPPTPTMEAVALIGQTQAAILASTRGPLTAVGIKIISHTAGPLIVVEKRWGPFDAGINLIDSQIIFEGKRSGAREIVAIRSDRSVYLNNVFVHGADVVVDGALPGRPGGWVHVKEFALGRTVSTMKGYRLSAPIFVDGRKRTRPFIDIAPGAAPPPDLESQHTWGPDFPSWESPKAANVKEPPYNARGDSYTDDTEALQRAIDENEIVFLPKGYYRITRTLKLRPNTQLIGVAQHLSLITARDPDRWFGPDGRPGPLVETADDPDAHTVIAFVGIRFPMEVATSFRGDSLPVYAIKWQCGRSSILRSSDVNPLRIYGFIGTSKRYRGKFRSLPLDGPAVWITGHGAGRWYNYHAGHFFMDTTRHSRAVLIEGTAGPLYFYNFEPQGGNGEAVAEMRRARHVSLYGCKTECDTTFLRVVDSDHIRVFGHGGIGSASAGGALYEFDGTANFLVSLLADQVNLRPDRPYYGGRSMHRNIESFIPLRDRPVAGSEQTVPSLERPVLYRRGQPRPEPTD